jgi:hypothetical protein
MEWKNYDKGPTDPSTRIRRCAMNSRLRMVIATLAFGLPEVLKRADKVIE